MIHEKMLSSDSIEWATPQNLFDEYNSRFGFTLDVCASDWNAKCQKYYDKEKDGLAQDWGKEICWMNPPYGKAIGDWMSKAVEEWRKGATVVCLVPARTDTRWFHNYAMLGEIVFLKGRLRFIDKAGEKTNPAPFPSAIVIYRGETNATN